MCTMIKPCIKLGTVYLCIKGKSLQYLLSALYFQLVALIFGVLLIEEHCNFRCVSIAYARLG